MQLIIIRGNAFSGKSLLAEKLGQNIGSKVLHVDYLKTAARKADSNLDIANVCSAAYKMAVEKLEGYLRAGESIVIVEELGKDKEFVDALKNFISKNHIEAQWFLLDVGLEELYRRREDKITVCEREGRVLKIEKEELPIWQKEIESQEIEGEIKINNNGSEEEGFASLLNAVRRGKIV